MSQICNWLLVATDLSQRLANERATAFVVLDVGVVLG